MILRIALLCVMLAGLLGVSAVGWIATHPQAAAEQAAAPTRTAVLVLAREVKAGALLRAEDLEAHEMAVADLPPGALPEGPASRRELTGGMLRRALQVGSVLRADDVLRPGDHGFLAAVLKPGMRAVTVGVDAVTGTAGLIWPGDRVDLILTQSMDDPKLSPGQRIAAETVLQNALVIAIDQLLVQGTAPETPASQGARTVTLEVTAREAERVQVAERIGRLSLTVRAAEPPELAAANVSAVVPQSTPVWAGDVSHAFRTQPLEATIAAPVVLRVYQGSTESKEFKY